ncbi:hypothetical protein EV421DRAFT_1813399 [Armillaria borealis]|uniref:Secreted protein n=1 Tax=Armillaria borealis TaxID=47425 RepID=A0AA39JDW8_9AGAR|nr:hypothetical protein EV421DRAFT_1813399 [Armillaria borealis]
MSHPPMFASCAFIAVLAFVLHSLISNPGIEANELVLFLLSGGVCDDLKACFCRFWISDSLAPTIFCHPSERSV